MFERACGPGETEVVITQGDATADFFYVIDHGACDVEVDGRCVATLRGGNSFGELELMYFAPRAATVRAVAETVLWVMDRVTFRALLVGGGSSKREQHKVRRPPSWPRSWANFSLL